MLYLRLIAQRLVITVLTLWGLATMVFFMVKLIPGDEAQVAAGLGASPDQVAAVAERLGLNAPFHEQYLLFMGRLVRGDLGVSILTSQPVLSELALALPSTVELLVATVFIGLLITIPAAIWAASHRDGTVDTATKMTSILAGGLPTFWLALMAQYLLGTVWRIVPISGQNSFGMAPPTVTGMPTVDSLIAGDGAAFLDSLHYLLLPAIIFAVPFVSQVFRILRATLLGILASEIIPPVRAKGARPAWILWRHALPNSLVPTINLVGSLVGGMMGGVILVETVFARRGIGTYLANAVTQKDTFAVLGTVMFVGASVCIVNLVADLAVLLVDPRLRQAASKGNAR